MTESPEQRYNEWLSSLPRGRTINPLKAWAACETHVADPLREENARLRMKESLDDKCSQKPLFEFEGFIIRQFDPWNLWFENPHGEGTQISKAHMLASLDRLFKEVF